MYVACTFQMIFFPVITLQKRRVSEKPALKKKENKVQLILRSPVGNILENTPSMPCPPPPPSDRLSTSGSRLGKTKMLTTVRT